MAILAMLEHERKRSSLHGRDARGTIPGTWHAIPGTFSILRANMDVAAERRQLEISSARIARSQQAVGGSER